MFIKTLANVRLLTVVLLGALLFSCGKQPELPKIEGVKGPFFNVLNGKVLISMTVDQLEVTTGGTLPIPHLPNSSLEITPAQFGGTFFQVSLDYNDLENGNFHFVDPQTLPGGRAIPGIVGGNLPAIAFAVHELNESTFYVSNKVFGFFLPVELKSQIGLTQRLVMDGNNIGNISLVGADAQGKNAGIFLLLNLDAAAKAKLKQLIDYSKKPGNTGRKF